MKSKDTCSMGYFRGYHFIISMLTSSLSCTFSFHSSTVHSFSFTALVRQTCKASQDHTVVNGPFIILHNTYRVLSCSAKLLYYGVHEVYRNRAWLPTRWVVSGLCPKHGREHHFHGSLWWLSYWPYCLGMEVQDLDFPHCYDIRIEFWGYWLPGTNSHA